MARKVAGLSHYQIIAIMVIKTSQRKVETNIKVEPNILHIKLFNFKI